MKTISLLDTLNTDDTEFSSIALECHNLSFLLKDQLQQARVAPRRSTTVFQNGWSTGLELYDSEADKGSDNKKNVILRVMEHIRSFIARIIERIKSIFGNENKNKELTAFIKNYKGPTDNDYTKVLNNYVKSMANKDESIRERLKALPAPTGEPTLETAEKRLEAVTGAPSTPEKTKSVYREQKLAQIGASLGSSRQSTMCVMLSKDFSEAFQEAASLCDSINNKRVFRDNLEEHAEVCEKIAGLAKHCNQLLSIDSKDNDLIGQWVLNENTQVVNRALGYVGADVIILYSTHYMKGFDVTIKELKTDESEATLAKLQVAQRMLSDFVLFVSLATKVSQTYDATCNAIRGF